VVRRRRQPDDRRAVIFYLLGGSHAKAELDSLKGWLAVHNAAVGRVIFVVFGVDLIAKGLPPLAT
jgi:acetyl esterase/lipase